MILTPASMRGLCCRAFILPYGPEELWEFAEAARAGKPKRHFSSDIILVADMVRYIGPRVCNQIAGWPYKGDGWAHVYSCRYIQPDGRCEIYWLRPHVCRIYDHCEYPNHCESTYCSVHPSNKGRKIKMPEKMFAEVKAYDKVFEQEACEIVETERGDRIVDPERSRPHAALELEQLIQKKEAELVQLRQALEWVRRNCPVDGPVEELIHRGVVSSKY